MQLYDITIAANSSRQLDAPGSYFYFYAGSAGGADSTITLRGLSTGLRLILKPGQAFKLPKGNVEQAWVITNYANAATIIGQVLVGNGDITDNRVTGSVEIVDGEKNRTMAGSVGLVTFQMSAVAAQYSKGGLWNPAGSGKRAIIRRVRVASNVAQDLYMGKVNAALTSVSTPASNLFDASVFGGVCKITAENSATSITSVSGIIGVQASQSIEAIGPEPIIVRPGYGLIFQSGLNSSLSGTLSFFEEADT